MIAMKVISRTIKAAQQLLRITFINFHIFYQIASLQMLYSLTFQGQTLKMLIYLKLCIVAKDTWYEIFKF